MSTYYGMFTDEGNNAVHEMLTMLHARMKREDRGSMLKALNEGLDRIEKDHGEVRDTMVRELIAGWVAKNLGYSFSIFEF